MRERLTNRDEQSEPLPLEARFVANALDRIDRVDTTAEPEPMFKRLK